MSNSQKSRVIFNPREIIEACTRAKASGKPRPLTEVFEISDHAHSCLNNTKYMKLLCHTASKHGELRVRFAQEVHVGQIVPLDEAEVARFNAERGDRYGVVKKRDRNPTINIQKYPVRIETDDQGRPKGDLPDKASEYFTVVELVDEFFFEEMEARLKSGRIVLRDNRRKDSSAGALDVPNTKIVPLVQTHVSATSKVNPDMELVNPICRISMKFDNETGLSKKAQFYDYTKPIYDNKPKPTSYEPLTFDGCPVTAYNVHRIRSHSKVSGIAHLDAVCSSNMGLSIPIEVAILVVEPPVILGVSISDVFEDEDEDGAEAAVKAPAAKAPAAAVSEDDLAKVLSELEVGDDE